MDEHTYTEAVELAESLPQLLERPSPDWHGVKVIAERLTEIAASE